MDLVGKKCVACESGAAPLNPIEIETLLASIPGWQTAGEALSIERSYSFHDFAEALAFVNAVGAIAEEEGHHPDIELGWGRVRVVLTTHSIGGLSENDFIVAAKIDAM